MGIVGINGDGRRISNPGDCGDCDVNLDLALLLCPQPYPHFFKPQTRAPPRTEKQGRRRRLPIGDNKVEPCHQQEAGPVDARRSTRGSGVRSGFHPGGSRRCKTTLREAMLRGSPTKRTGHRLWRSLMSFLLLRRIPGSSSLRRSQWTSPHGCLPPRLRDRERAMRSKG